MQELDDFLFSGPRSCVSPQLVLAHGAGAPMDSDFMETMAALLAQRQIGVVRFEFPYMQLRRRLGTRRPPDRAPVLLDYWRQVVARLGDPQSLFIGGKSMGGRMASMVADELGVSGLVCLGYPFHPPGKPDKMRTEHLVGLTTAARLFQGTRDPMGTKDEVTQLNLSDSVEMVWLEDGDHDLKPRKRSGYTQMQHLQNVADEIASFMQVNT